MPTSRSLTWAFALLLLVSFAACSPGEDAEDVIEDSTAGPTEVEDVDEAGYGQGDLLVATADLRGAQGTEHGSIVFSALPGGTGVRVEADLENVPPGVHGFHVHETGECAPPDFSSAGGHFNPAGTPHAGPDVPERHAGDFGNVEIGAGGSGRLELTTDLLTIRPGDRSVVGKAVILHAGEDDLTSQPSGDAGSRLACGVVVLSGEQYLDETTVDADGEVMEQEEE